MAHYIFLILLGFIAAVIVGQKMFSTKTKEPLSKEEIVSGVSAVVLIVIGFLGIAESLTL